MYVIVWEFHVTPLHEEEFVLTYGKDGEWTRLFRQDEGYLSTELLQDLTKTNRFMTIDRWTSRSAYDRFRARRHSEYQALDQRCESWTESETALGAFGLP